MISKAEFFDFGEQQSFGPVVQVNLILFWIFHLVVTRNAPYEAAGRLYVRLKQFGVQPL